MLKMRRSRIKKRRRMLSPLDADADAAGAPDRAPAPRARPPGLRGVASSRGSCARTPWSPLARHSRAARCGTEGRSRLCDALLLPFRSFLILRGCFALPPLLGTKRNNRTDKMAALRT